MNHQHRTFFSVGKNFVILCGLILCIICGANPIFAQQTPQNSLTIADVQAIIAQAVSTAIALNQKVTVAVTDHEGNVLGLFSMTGATPITRIRSVGANGRGLEGVVLPDSARLAAVSKAGTASLFSTSGNAFTTRTASFIIQEHFPPGIDNRPGGPLYGVQFSSLICSDVAVAGLPLGLSGDPGGIPLYKNGVAVGGVGVEGDGIYTIDRDPRDEDQPFEEIIAVSAAQNFSAPPLIRGDNILVEGIRFPFANVDNPPAVTPISFQDLPGFVLTPVRAALPSAFTPVTLNGVNGEASSRFYPAVAGSALSAAEVQQILGQAALTANITRAGIRQPLGSNARVSIAVVDVDGRILGIFRQADAPVFGFDVSAQKARTAAFLARPDAGAQLQAAGLGSYVARAAADGIGLNGSIAFSTRGFGFLHRPLFPDGINDTDAGPFSTRLGEWSPFNVGLQLDLIQLSQLLSPFTQSPLFKNRRFLARKAAAVPNGCTSIPGLKNGMQIFAGGIPLYRGNTLVGAIGISGDGIDQDDFISAGGANNFAAPPEMRSDRVFVRGARLPFIKIPARPTL